MLLKSWINDNKKICSSKQQLTFLISCRRYDLIPTHIKNLKINIVFHSNSIRRKFDKFKKLNQLKLLNFEIEDLNINLNYLHKKIKNIEERLFESLPHDLVTTFFELSKHRITSFDYKIKNNSIKKINDLKQRYNFCLNPFSNIDKSKWLVNISNKAIPDTVSDLLSLGDNFALPMQRDQKNDRFNYVLDVVKNFEVKCNIIPTDVIETTRISVANTLQRFLCGKKHTNYLDRYILNAFSLSKKYLRENNDIMVTKADKGQITVVMDKKDYYDKMDLLLNDQSTYKKLKKDPIKQLTNRINTLIKSWRKNDLIDETTYKYLNCTNGNLPRCYGLPKIHKDGFPLRMIVSSLGSPVYNISSYIHKILHSSIKKPNSHIKDGWSFVTNIKNMCINDDNIMISLDVCSLFTNIPKDLVMNAIRRRWDDIAKNTKFNLTQFLYAIELILDSTCFAFDGHFYEQIFGSPMGSPLSPVLADMVMDDLETQCLSSLNFTVPMYYRFVDDVFAIVPRTKIDEILMTFNNYHERLKFTHEIEVNSSINFLNATVIRCDNRLITNWYRKPTWSGRYINYHSNHPLKYKINTIYNLVDHAILLSNDSFQQNNIKLVHDILLNNCFPEHIIKRHIQKRINVLNKRDHNKNVDANLIHFDRTSFISLPYVKDTSHDLCRLLQDSGFNVVYKITKKLNTLIKRGKDILHNNDKTNVVYKLNCKNCNVSYIGQTKRHVRTRVKEHSNNIKLHETNHSVISKHRLESGHEFDWTKPNILHNEKYVRKREIAEMFYIKKFNDTINLQKDTDNLNNIYDKIIKVV